MKLKQYKEWNNKDTEAITNGCRGICFHCRSSIFLNENYYTLGRQLVSNQKYEEFKIEIIFHDYCFGAIAGEEYRMDFARSDFGQ